MNWTGPSYTPVKIPEIQPRIRFSDNLLLTGSCFSEHIAQKLRRFRYNILENPFGILYNPVSLAKSMTRIVKKSHSSVSDLVYHGGLYHSMDHHGSFSGPDPEQVILTINQQIDEAHAFLKTCDFIFISPGTSGVYTQTSSGAIVGNCHKIPSAQFTHARLSVSACFDAFEKLYQDIKSICPAVRLIWTVSPVRHLRDGLVENQRSKAALVLAIDQMISMYPDCAYFPAYEIMVDQLRDYRYYDRDLTHPSAEAIDIIWELFRSACLDPNDLVLHPKIESIRRAMEHRFLHALPEEQKRFAMVQLEQIDQLEKLCPDIRWEEERYYFQRLIQP